MPIGHIEYHSSVTDEWTAIPPLPADEDGQRYIGGPNGDFEFMYSQVPGTSWTAARLETARQWIQANVFDRRIDRAILPQDHPYVSGGDPSLEWLFWDGPDVVERLIIVDEIAVTGTDPNTVPRLTLRRIKR